MIFRRRWAVLTSLLPVAFVLSMLGGCDKGVGNGQATGGNPAVEKKGGTQRERPAAADADKKDTERSHQGKPISAWIAQLQDKDEDDDARIKAAQALGEMFVPRKWQDVPEAPPEAVLRALAQALKDKNDTVRFVATESLIRCGERGAPVFLDALKDKDVLARRAAARGLAARLSQPGFALTTPSPTAVPALSEALLKDQDAQVRQAAAMSLGEIGKPSVPVLIAAAKTGDAEARRLALEALGRVGTPHGRKAVPDLIELLKEKDEALRGHVAQTLGRLGNDAGEALPALLAASKSEDEGGQAARDALQKISKAPRSAAPALLAFLKDPEPSIRLKAIAVLCDMEEGDKECLASLLELVKRRDSKVRQETARLLFGYGSAAKEAVPALVEIVRNDADPQTRIMAINALGAIGPEAKEAIPALKAAREDKQYGGVIGIAATQALKKIEQ